MSTSTLEASMGGVKEAAASSLALICVPLASRPLA